MASGYEKRPRVDPERVEDDDADANARRYQGAQGRLMGATAGGPARDWQEGDGAVGQLNDGARSLSDLLPRRLTNVTSWCWSAISRICTLPYSSGVGACVWYETVNAGMPCDKQDAGR